MHVQDNSGRLVENGAWLTYDWAIRPCFTCMDSHLWEASPPSLETLSSLPVISFSPIMSARSLQPWLDPAQKLVALDPTRVSCPSKWILREPNLQGSYRIEALKLANTDFSGESHHELGQRASAPSRIRSFLGYAVGSRL